MKEYTFYGVLLSITAVFGGLSYACYIQLATSDLTNLLLIQLIHTFGCFTLLGLGIGIPMLLLATLLGLGQLIMLMTGHVTPHFSKDGFFQLFETIFSRF